MQISLLSDYSTAFTVIFFTVGGLISFFFYGLKAYELHDNKQEAEEKKQNDSLLRKINQTWLNFLGSFTGWVFLYYFLVVRMRIFSPDFSFSNFMVQPADYILLLVTFIGITGYLPYMILLKGIRY